MNSMKVYGGRSMIRGHGQVRCIVAALNQKEAARIADVSLYEFRNYWSQTWNKHEIAAATAQPGVLLFSQNDYGDDRVFEPVEQ